MANFSTGQMSLQSEFVDREATGHHSADSIFIRISLPCDRSVQNMLVKVCVLMKHLVRSSAYLLT